jgi:hypothetical protein
MPTSEDEDVRELQQMLFGNPHWGGRALDGLDAYQMKGLVLVSRDDLEAMSVGRSNSKVPVTKVIARTCTCG